jgi:hypothetical protein
MADAPPPDLFTRRVCLQREGMDLVPVRRDIPYGQPTDDRRVMDVYYPLGESEGGWPVVVIVVGYPGTLEPRPTPLRYKEIGWTVSTAQLIASAGMAAVAYANCEPVADLRALLDHLQTQAAPLGIDPSRLGIMATSGNVPTALTTILRTAERPPACAAFGCGCLLDLDGATDVADASRQFGFVNACAGLSVDDFRRDVPLFISRAGRDQFPAMNASIDRFVAKALADNLPITLVNHTEGPHGFDLFDDSRTSRDIVRQTLRFLRQHLTPEASRLEI